MTTNLTRTNSGQAYDAAVDTAPGLEIGPVDPLATSYGLRVIRYKGSIAIVPLWELIVFECCVFRKLFCWVKGGVHNQVLQAGPAIQSFTWKISRISPPPPPL